MVRPIIVAEAWQIPKLTFNTAKARTNIDLNVHRARRVVSFPSTGTNGKKLWEGDLQHGEIAIQLGLVAHGRELDIIFVYA